jgi:hypothetical protein
MELRYQLTVADFREAQYHNQKRSAATYVLFAGGIFFTTLGASRGSFWQLFAGLSLLLFPILMHLSYLRRVQISPDFGQAITVVPGPDGLFLACPLAEGTTKWAAFTRFREARNQFVVFIRQVFIRQGAFCIIPKRAFSALELEEFRNLLTNYIPRK